MPKGEKLTLRQRQFAAEFLIDLNATGAARRAGYSENGIRVMATRLLANPNVQQAITEARKELEKATAITQQAVLNALWENAKRAMQEYPVFDRNGKPTGEYVYEGQVANRALELIGKHLQMFPETPNVTNIQNNLTQQTILVVYDEPPPQVLDAHSNGSASGPLPLAPPETS